MPMMTKRALTKAFDNGFLDDVYREVRLYGNIISDREWSIDDLPRYNGAWRELAINHAGKGWKFTLHNGQIESASMFESPLMIGVKGDPVTKEDDDRHRRILAM